MTRGSVGDHQLRGVARAPGPNCIAWICLSTRELHARNNPPAGKIRLDRSGPRSYERRREGRLEPFPAVAS
jgi:hypothetical protein